MTEAIDHPHSYKTDREEDPRDEDDPVGTDKAVQDRPEQNREGSREDDRQDSLNGKVARHSGSPCLNEAIYANYRRLGLGPKDPHRGFHDAALGKVP
jgi:hypothetical protein